MPSPTSLDPLEYATVMNVGVQFSSVFEKPKNAICVKPKKKKTIKFQMIAKSLKIARIFFRHPLKCLTELHEKIT